MTPFYVAFTTVKFFGWAIVVADGKAIAPATYPAFLQKMQTLLEQTYQNPLAVTHVQPMDAPVPGTTYCRVSYHIEMESGGWSPPLSRLLKYPAIVSELNICQLENRLRAEHRGQPVRILGWQRYSFPAWVSLS